MTKVRKETFSFSERAATRDSLEFFEFTKEAFDKMPLFVKVFVIFSLLTSIFLRRNKGVRALSFDKLYESQAVRRPDG